MTYKIEPDRIICHDSRQRADGSWLKFGVEAPREFSLSPVESLLEASKIIDDTFKACNTPSLTDFNTGQPEVIQVDKGSDSAVEGIIKDIGNCPDLPNLNQYKWVKGSDPRIEEAFTKRLKELS